MKRTLFMIAMTLVALPLASQQIPITDKAEDAQQSVPAPLAGKAVSMRPVTGRELPSFMSGGIAISQLYTDNAELSTANGSSDLSYEIAPHLAIGKSGTRLSYDLGAFGGVLLNRKLNQRNQATEGADLALSYRLSQFVTFRIDDDFANSNGLWSGTGGASNTEVGAAQQANNSLFTYQQFRSNSVLAELAARLSPDTYAGVRGSQTHLTFPSSPMDPVLGTLYGGDNYLAEAFYNHHFTVRNWGGITLRARRFDIDRSEGRTDAGSLLLFYAFNVRPTVSLSFFGGPELSVSTLPASILPVTTFQRRKWSPDTGAVFSWQGQRTGLTASFTRQISNGGGLLSAVTLSSVGGELVRRIGRRFEVDPGFVYSLNDPIVPTPSFRTYSGQFQSTYRVGSYSLSAGYARDDRAQLNSHLDASANRIWIAFSYDFTKPLGR